MQQFHNILFVSQGIENEVEGLKQAISLAHNNKASLKVLVVCPEPPDSHDNYKKSYEDFLKERMEKSIQITQVALKLRETELNIAIEVESGAAPAIRIIRHVLRDGHDLIIKEAEFREGGKGFEALDMTLLRKSPCPVWLCRPIKHSHSDIQVAVAIDPENEEQVGRDLALKLLDISRSLADMCSGKLIIISCWNYQYENYLRDSNSLHLSKKEIQEIVTQTQLEHRLALEILIKEANIGDNYQLQHVKGLPAQVMGKVIEDEKVDILVMGTLARTGIPGFIIGNTAENIVQKLGCSLLALKPNGFVSPVSAY